MSFLDNIIGKFRTDTSVGETPDAQTVYFKNGKMYKVYPSDKESWYDARYLVSDGKTYDLENVEDIKRIPIPKFNPHDDMMEGYGITGSLDYVVRMKAGSLYNRGEKELCSACLWKSTELMFNNTSCSWRKNDYTRLISWHYKLGMDSEAEKAIVYLKDKGLIFTESELIQYKKPLKSHNTQKKSKPKESISNADKELVIVKNVTTEDMRSVENMPFVCNVEVDKCIKKGVHPFAYMNIVGENIEIVKSEIEIMNSIIKEDLKKYKGVPKNLKIPTNKLVFCSEFSGYTKIMCTPKTYTGKPSKFPFSLFFATDLSKMGSGDTTHGELFYGQDGKVNKGNIYFWRKGKPTFLFYKTVDGKLTLYNIE